MLLPLHMNMLLEGAGGGTDVTVSLLGAVSQAQAGRSTFDDGNWTAITNSGAATYRSNYEICPISGFRQYPRWDHLSKLRKRWDGQYARLDSLDPRHPQEYRRSSENVSQKGPDSPELDDTFIETTVYELADNTSNSAHLLFDSVAVVNTEFHYHVFVKDVDRRYVWIGVKDNNNNYRTSVYDIQNQVAGTGSNSGATVSVTSQTFQKYPNGWYKIGQSITVTVATASQAIYVGLSDTRTPAGSAIDYSYIGDGSSALFTKPFLSTSANGSNLIEGLGAWTTSGSTSTATTSDTAPFLGVTVDDL